MKTLISRTRRFLACLAMPLLGLANAATSARAVETVVWSDNFDDPGATSRWSASAGVWEVGMVASGPGTGYSGTRCAGTVLGGNYPPGANSRLGRIASFVVPAASQHPRLRFWHWFSNAYGDQGRVQVREAGGAWTNLSAESYGGSGGVWTRPSLGLSAYAGREIQNRMASTWGI